MSPLISLKSLSTETWNDFATLMRTDSQCKECWCLNHRQPPGCPTGDAAQKKMQSLTENNLVHGILAYQGNECIGWIAVDSISELHGHDCQTTGKDDEWSIHCLFVKDGHRGKGVSTHLIHAAMKYSKEQGAQIVSAFPIPSEQRHRFPENAAEFSGRYSTFVKLGFKAAGEGSSFYQRMEFQTVLL